ncbi:MAG: hypothetical protein V4572_09925 [Bacteroidota bacterium]
MNNRIFLIIIGIGILSSFIGITLTYTSSDYETIELGRTTFDYGLRISSLIGLIMLLYNGTFVNTKYFKIVQVIVALVIVGALLRIMHWIPYTDHIIIIGLIGIAISYFLSFLNKPIKKRLDYLKLTWVITTYTLASLILLHLINREYSELGTYILWLTIIDFAVTGQKNRTIFQ